MTYANVMRAGDAAVLRYRALAFVIAAAITKEQPPLPSMTVEPSEVVQAFPTTVPAASPWSCIAVAETSNEPAMGPTYWTEYGVVRDVIEDFGAPAEQAAIFGMTADHATRLAPVARFAAVHGFGGWGERTKEVCGL